MYGTNYIEPFNHISDQPGKLMSHRNAVDESPNVDEIFEMFHQS